MTTTYIIFHVLCFYVTASIIGYCIVKFLPKFIERKINKESDIQKFEIEPFSVTEYFDRMEQAALEILEKQKQIDQTIILWLGRDGLRLNEDGTTEWISRKKQTTVEQEIFDQSVIPTGTFSQNVFCQPCQSIQTWPDETQSTRAQIEELMTRNAALQNTLTRMDEKISMLQTTIIPVYPYNSPYMQPPYLQSALAYPLTQCCFVTSCGRTMDGKIIRD